MIHTTIGEITRCGSLAKAEDLPFNKLIGTVIVERVIDLLMLMFTMMLVAFLEFDVLSGFLSEKLVEPILGKSNGVLGMLLFFGTGLAGIIAFVMILKYGGNSKFVQKLRKITADIVAGLRSVLRMQKNGWFLFHTFFIWFIYFLMTYVCFYCLDATSHLDIKAGMFVLVIGGLGMSAPVQGGIGARG